MKRWWLAMAAFAAVLSAGCKGPMRAFRRSKPRVTRTLDRASFHRAVRPALASAGCASGGCHGSNLIGLHLGSGDDEERFRDASRYVRPGLVSQSALLTKPLGRDHQGGVNLSQEQCEARVLIEWIRGGRPSPCPPREDHRVRAGTVPPAMPPSLDEWIASCAESQCHGERARPLLFAPHNSSDRELNSRSLAAYTMPFAPSMSRLLRAARGERGHVASLSAPDSAPWRALFAWMTGEGAVDGELPSWSAYASAVNGVLMRRGCATSACHGAADSPLSLVDNSEASADNYLRVVRALREGSFPSKPRNTEAHGGGRRIGGAEDCASRVIDAWIAGREPEQCPSPPAPDRAQFASVVQPSLEALTCHRCHEDGTGGFWFSRAAPGEFVQRNYDNVLAKIDLEYPPASHVLLRVREDCMQTKMLAWVARQPMPSCTVRLANFRGSFPTMNRRADGAR
jgi:hypothetical protein